MSHANVRLLSAGAVRQRLQRADDGGRRQQDQPDHQLPAAEHEPGRAPQSLLLRGRRRVGQTHQGQSGR